ncbi:MAG: alpha/beta fold hydrolase [Pseudolabrys sp.]
MRPIYFTGASGNRLAADVFGDSGGPVLMLHGGGQTRHAWRKTAVAVARAGRTAYAVDQRGHGDSEWIESGAYKFHDYAADATALGRELAKRHSELPVAIGASLGGMASLLAQGASAEMGEDLFGALVLVDITPRVDANGVDKIIGFMSEHAREGFASVEEAADAVASYLPHRPRPKSNEGLQKNLRRGADGRWRWHWDPRFLESRGPDGGDRSGLETGLVSAARRLSIPTLLVRGASSELVKEEHVREFRNLVPHAEFADVSGARHMVAGDQNDSFSTAILDFLTRLPSGRVSAGV